MFLVALSGLPVRMMGRWYCHLGVSPLFETIDDLHRSEEVQGQTRTHRTAGGRSKVLVRAISWVLTWGQSRHTISAWFGIGVALAAWRNANPVRLAKLQVMYREWLFFRTLLSNAQMALAKTDLSTAGEYEERCEDEAVAKQALELIDTEFRRARKEILAAADSRSLLQENPALAISLANRSEHLDPLNSAQVALLRRLGELPADEQTR